MIAAETVGAGEAWVYVRGEYPEATSRVEAAVAQVDAAGWLRDGLAHRGPARRRGLHLRRGDRPLQLHRGLPGRAPQQAPLPHDQRPLRPTHRRQQPRDPPERPAHRPGGPRGLPGRGHRAVAGHPPVLPVGPDRAVPGSTRPRSASPWGTCSTWPAASRATWRPSSSAARPGCSSGPTPSTSALTLEDTRAAGATLGSGVVMAFDTTVDLTDVVVRIAEFFRSRVLWPVRALPRRYGARPRDDGADAGAGWLDRRPATLLDEMATAMTDASICGLGHTAVGAVPLGPGPRGWWAS